MGTPDPVRRSERARTAVLESTIDLCRADGFARMTIEGIAERAGVSKKTIYRWWSSKGEVLLEALAGRAEIAAAFPDSGDLVRDMCAQTMSVVELLSPQETSPYASLVAEGQRDPALSAAIRTRLVDPFIARFDERMHSAVAARELPASVDLGVAVDLFYGPIYHRLVFGLGLPDGPQLETRVRHVVAALRSGGVPRPPAG
ncbi:TetR/AcrR family transcriptional regulator [Leifsonia sp. NPDC080035]|uniref:TetR/AcrR family transcriptional regulator n=1 Tax=Leifsonia sp. NPDC080035 TaxID=3143936 RepID=A0AAU7GFV0_9MICO